MCCKEWFGLFYTYVTVRDKTWIRIEQPTGLHIEPEVDLTPILICREHFQFSESVPARQELGRQEVELQEVELQEVEGAGTMLSSLQNVTHYGAKGLIAVG
uniref:Uncharacterized protein n=1 Tax=Knipowitschia caucasica TaxID=637954 RepID=A0AAV2LC25_KNICA